MLDVDVFFKHESLNNRGCLFIKQAFLFKVDDDWHVSVRVVSWPAATPTDGCLWVRLETSSIDRARAWMAMACVWIIIGSHYLVDDPVPQGDHIVVILERDESAADALVLLLEQVDDLGFYVV